MKLKKAMKLYPIEKIGGSHYRLGKKTIFMSGSGAWWKNSDDPLQYPESLAVAWLVEGAKKLSPMERAMREYPIKKRGNIYSLGEKVIGPSVNDGWFRCDGFEAKKYTEKEAVAYLLEGYKKDEPKLPGYDIKGLNGVTIHYDQESSKAVMNNLWNAGYRPTKEAK
jgi:hypothetical protein